MAVVFQNDCCFSKMRMVLVFQYRVTYFFVGDLLAHGVQYFTSLLCWLPDACLSRHSIISTPNQVFFMQGILSFI